VAHEEDAQAGGARQLQHFQNPRQHLVAMWQLAQDPDLHVIDDQRGRIGMHRFGKGPGDLKA
jgi:hypothetical protein